MATIATATPNINISYTLSSDVAFSSTSESANVGYDSLSYSDGSGTGNINMGVVLTGYINSGETVYLDFKNLPKSVWDSDINLNFTTETIANPVGGYDPVSASTVKSMIITNTWNSSIANVGTGSIDAWSGIVGHSGISGVESSFTTGLPHYLLPKLRVNATGNIGSLSGGFTDILTTNINATGALDIGPNSTWSFNDTIGKSPIYDAAAGQFRHVLTLTAENFSNISGSGGLSSGTSGDAVLYPIWNDTTSGNPWSGNLPRLSYEILVVGVTG